MKDDELPMLVIELNDLAYHFITKNEHNKATILLKKAEQLLNLNPGIADVQT